MNPGGFTVVFRLARTTRSTAARQKSVALELVEAKLAEQVFRGRDTLAVGDPMSALYVVEAGDDRSTRGLLEQLETDSRVELAYVAPPRDVLSDRTTFFAVGSASEQDWHEQIKLSEALGLPQWKGQTPVSIAVLDSGLDTAHAQLASIPLEEHLGKPPRAPDAIGHGTHVTGLVGATSDAVNGFEGLAAECTEIVVHRGISRPHDVAGYYRALRATLGARIINLSVGGVGLDPTESELIADAIASDSIVVAAMGNEGDLGSPTTYPAALPDVIAVGAVDRQGQRADFSNVGDHIFIAAPGVDILSTVPTYKVPNVAPSGRPPLASMSGTSMATPIITSVIAHMLAWSPALARAQVIDLLRGSLGGSWNEEIGRGVIDMHATLAQL